MWLWDEYRPARPHQWDGNLSDVRTARLDGLAALSEDALVVKAGATAGLIITVLLRFFPLSPIRHNNILLATLFLVGYGALLGIWRKRDLVSGKRYYLFNRVFMQHTLFNYIFVPLMPTLYTFILPDINPNVASSTDTFTASFIMILIFFWTGAVFDYIWEGVHNYCLAHFSKLTPDVMHTHTIRMWIQTEEKHHNFRLDDVQCVNGEITVHGRFEDPAELRRKLELIDFVRHAHVVQVKGGAA